MTAEAPVWIIDDDAAMLWVLERALTRAGWPVRTFERGEPALTALTEQAPAAVLTDVRMPGIDGLALAERLQHERPALPVIVMTAHSDLDTTVAAFEGGAFDYLAKPFDLDAAVALVERACAPPPAGEPAVAAAPASSPLVGQAPAMQSLFRTIARLARAPITVLITGESGTGKELVAQALHRHSPRAQRPFVALNTAAIPHELLESELFGHEKGAFTGADSQRQGRFEQADGGTLFLDEIGDMPAALQTRLLRVLAAGTFYRVGGSTPCNVDVRILAATHQELERPFVIEKEGDEWRLPEDYAVSYCEECVAEHRTEVRLLEAETLDDALERENVDLREVVRSMVKINWRHLRDAFKPSDPSNLETIPVGEGA